jgi:hypothetical protein
LPASFTVACSVVVNAVLIVALCGVPAVAAMVAASPGMFVRLKLAGVVTPVALAVTVYAPVTKLAVKAGAMAIPVLLVVAVFTPLANVPLAPLLGAVKVTVAPTIGLLLASFSVACSGVANAELIIALCGVPPVAVMLGPALAAGRTSTMLRSYRSVVGAVSLMVTLVPLAGVVLVWLVDAGYRRF